MLKQKLIQKRKEKGFFQAVMAYKMNMDTLVIPVANMAFMEYLKRNGTNWPKS